MKKEISEKTKSNAVKRYLDGESVISISERIGVSRTSVYTWINAEKDTLKKESKIKTSSQELYDLCRTVKRLTQTVAVLKEVNCCCKSDLSIRLEELSKLYGKCNIHILCDALNVSRGTFYNHIKRNKGSDVWYLKRREELLEIITRIYEEHKGVYGARKIAAIMRENGTPVSDKIVLEIMSENNQKSCRNNAKKDYKKFQRRKNLTKQCFSPARPNEVWVSDVTYLNYNERFYYLCVILDLFSRKVVGYKFGVSISTQLSKAALKSAIANRGNIFGVILHTDNGSCYVSMAFEKVLKINGISHSYSNSHSPKDNAVNEAFFRNFKTEEFYRNNYTSLTKLQQAIDNYIFEYNHNRPHSTLAYKTPDKFEEIYYSKEISEV